MHILHKVSPDMRLLASASSSHLQHKQEWADANASQCLQAFFFHSYWILSSCSWIQINFPSLLFFRRRSRKPLLANLHWHEALLGMCLNIESLISIHTDAATTHYFHLLNFTSYCFIVHDCVVSSILFGNALLIPIKMVLRCHWSGLEQCCCWSLLLQRHRC